MVASASENEAPDEVDVETNAYDIGLRSGARDVQHGHTRRTVLHGAPSME